jgi:hypothetical protein
MAWAPDYLTTAEVKSFLRIETADTADDALIAVAISAASRAVDNHCNRQFGVVATPEERFYTPRYDYERGAWMVDVDDFMTATALVVEVAETAITEFVKLPRNAAAKGRPWTRLRLDDPPEVTPTGVEDEIGVTASWGWTAVPAAAGFATRLQVSRWHARRDAPFGVAGSPDQGSELRLLARLDPDVAVSLRDLVRVRGVG